MIRTFTLLILCVLSSTALANLNGYLASSGASKESLEQVEYSEYGAYLHFDQLPKVLFLRDSIRDGDIFDFRRALRKHPSISALVLDSEGGLVREALLIAGVVSDRGMTTYVPTGALCSSACSFIYFAGKSRLVKGALGVHQFSNADNTKRDNVNEVQQNTQYTTSEIIGFLNAFDTPVFVYEEMFASSKMYYFTKEEQIKLSSHESLATLTSVDTFIGNLRQEADLQKQKAELQKQKAELQKQKQKADLQKQKQEVELQKQKRKQRIGAIKSLQTELKRLGCYNGLVDGAIGNNTEKALLRYLKRKPQLSDLGTNSLVELTKKLTKEKRVECNIEKAVSAPKVQTPKVQTPKVQTPKPDRVNDSIAYFDAANLKGYKKVRALENFIIEYPKSTRLGDAYFLLGGTYYFDFKALHKAIESLTLLVKLKYAHNKKPYAMYLMGNVYNDLGQLINSKNMYRQVIQKFPQSKAGKLSREKLYKEFSETDSSRAYTVTQPPNDPKAAYRAAYELIRKRQFNASIVALLAFVKNFPQSALVVNAYYWLGEVYMVQGDASLAIVSFENVFSKHTQHRKIPDALYGAGVAYKNIGNVSKANKLWQRVIAEYPQSSAARKALEEVN